MAEIEWRQIEDINIEREYRLALIEAQRKIAEQLVRMNDNIEILLKSGVPDKDPD